MSLSKKIAFRVPPLTKERLKEIDNVLSVLEEPENDDDDPNEVLGFIIRDFMAAPSAVPRQLFSRFCDAVFSNEIDNDCREEALELFKAVPPPLQTEVVIALDTYVSSYSFTDNDALFIPFICRVASRYGHTLESSFNSIFVKIRHQYNITFEDIEKNDQSKFPEMYRQEFQHILSFHRNMKLHNTHESDQAEAAEAKEEEEEEVSQIQKRKRIESVFAFSLEDPHIAQLQHKLATKKIILIFDLDDTLIHGDTKNGRIKLRPGLKELWDWIRHLKVIFPALTIGLWTHAADTWKQRACGQLGIDFDFSISRTDLEKMPSAIPAQKIAQMPKNLHDPHVVTFVKDQFRCEVNPKHDLIIFVDDRENGIADKSHHYLIEPFLGSAQDTGLLRLQEDLHRIIHGLAHYPDSLDDFTQKKEHAGSWWTPLVERLF